MASSAPFSPLFHSLYIPFGHFCSWSYICNLCILHSIKAVNNLKALLNFPQCSCLGCYWFAQTCLCMFPLLTYLLWADPTGFIFSDTLLIIAFTFLLMNPFLTLNSFVDSLFKFVYYLWKRKYCLPQTYSFIYTCIKTVLLHLLNPLSKWLAARVDN